VTLSIAALESALAGRYRPEREVGQGGMATVFLANDLKHGRPVAIKVLSPEVSEALGRERFLREIQMVARLNHPLIVPVHDSGEAGGLLWYVMPLVAGESLRSRLDRERQLPVEDALRITRDVANALDYAHRQGVIHRDIKPENILFSEGHALVTDFGIARPASTTGKGSLTTRGLVLGTPHYMSPEQAVGGTTDGRTDVYSLGCVVYEMLAGHPPFSGSVEAVIARHLADPVPPLRTVRPAVSESLVRAVEKSLQKTPADRHPSPREFSSALERAASDAATKPERSTPAVRSLVVLPFENLSRDPQEEFFADGMTETLITQLAKIRSLRVISRTSAMRYKGAPKPLSEIAKELDVEAVVEGSVLRVGGRVRLSAQLIDAARDTHLWAESYDADSSDVLALQRDIAQAIAGEIKVQLTPQEQKSLADARPVVPEAYDCYLRGRFQLNQRTESGIRGALVEFKRAVGLDATFALAYSAVSMGYILVGEYGLMPPDEAYPAAKTWATRALEIEPALGAGHVSHAYATLLGDHDVMASERGFLRAVELDPSNAVVHQWYSNQLCWTGRFDAAIASMRRALALDPLSQIIQAWLGYMLTVARHPAEAVEHLERVVKFDPTFGRSYMYLGFAYLSTGEPDKAVRVLERGRTLTDPTEVLWAAFIGYAYARAGRVDDARAIAARLEAESAARYVSPYHVAMIHAGLGDESAALHWLEQAFAIRHSWLMRLWADPSFDGMRGRPAFDALLQRTGFTGHWPPAPQAVREG
jgi:serine/threonine protein kinase/tetratricopeptide (TPR) repeat protein